MKNFETFKHCAGCYRTRKPLEPTEYRSKYFGQITKKGRKWRAAILCNKTGVELQFAGVWRTRKEAVDECQRVLTKTFY